MANLVELLINITVGSALLISGAYLLSRSIESELTGVYSYIENQKQKQRKDGYMGAFFVSVIVTAIVQSSSAVTVLAVSLVDSGLMNLTSAMAVVYGANIGTTITAQMMSLDVSSYGTYILGAGVCLLAASFVKSNIQKRIKFVSLLMISIGLLFTGIMTLHLSAHLIKDSDYVMGFIKAYGSNKLYCILFGFISTALVHSSSATVGVTIALFSGGVINISQAVCIILGDNIGTCMTAQIAAATATANGRRVAWGHTMYNVIGSVFVYIFLERFIYAVRAVTGFFGQGEGYYIANAHTVFNIASALAFLPINRIFCRFLRLVVKQERGEREVK